MFDEICQYKELQELNVFQSLQIISVGMVKGANNLKGTV